MITDDLQYRVTKAHAARFDEALRNLEGDQGPDRKRRELEIAAVRAQLGDLHAELAGYDELRSGMIRSFEGASLPELAMAFVTGDAGEGAAGYRPRGGCRRPAELPAARCPPVRRPAGSELLL